MILKKSEFSKRLENGNHRKTQKTSFIHPKHIKTSAICLHKPTFSAERTVGKLTDTDIDIQDDWNLQVFNDGMMNNLIFVLPVNLVCKRGKKAKL